MLVQHSNSLFLTLNSLMRVQRRLDKPDPLPANDFGRLQAMSLPRSYRLSSANRAKDPSRSARARVAKEDCSCLGHAPRGELPLVRLEHPGPASPHTRANRTCDNMSFADLMQLRVSHSPRSIR